MYLRQGLPPVGALEAQIAYAKSRKRAEDLVAEFENGPWSSRANSERTGAVAGRVGSPHLPSSQSVWAPCTALTDACGTIK